MNLIALIVRRGNQGGVAVYLTADVKGESIDLTMFSQELKAEFTGVLIPQLSLVIVAMYRSPSGHANVFLGLLELCLTFWCH